MLSYAREIVHIKCATYRASYFYTIEPSGNLENKETMPSVTTLHQCEHQAVVYVLLMFYAD
jgi:hypothetical protein